jgi:hypothetical protein
VRPDQLAGAAVERDDRPPRAAGRVQHAVDGEGRAFELELGTRSEHVGLEPPRDLEALKVRGVDLIERRVLRAAQIRGVMRPVTARDRRRTRRAILAGKAGADSDERSNKTQQANARRHVPSLYGRCRGVS